MQKITTHLWFDGRAEEAVGHYTSLFPDSRVVDVRRNGETGPGEPGAVTAVSFELAGQRFIAFDGGPGPTFGDALALYVDCADQAEVDMFWEGLGEGGEEGRGGRLTDRFGVTWQIVPRAVTELLGDPDRDRAARVTKAMAGMRKLDVAALQNAARD